MSLYTWTGLPSSAVDSIATRRMHTEAATLLGETSFGVDEERDAMLAELANQANTYTYTEVVTLLNQLQRQILYQPLGNPGFAIDTNFDVKNATAIYYLNGGTVKTLGANTSFDTGTTKTITGSKFGAAVLSVSAAGTATVTWAAAVAYDSEALALAALTSPGATHTILGAVTLQAHASGFTAGTDALTTGTGGNVATATTYYNTANPNGLLIGSAVS